MHDAVNCSKCGTANPIGAHFCSQCGSELVHLCTNCHNPLPAGAVFCPICGHQAESPTGAPVAAPVASVASTEDRVRRYIPAALLEKLEAASKAGGKLQGERRQVTMLFCDVQGSSSAAEHLDPEDWADIMNGAFEHLITPVYSYEGTLARLMGDAILAFFGAPISHEDDPERAVRAALEIIEGIGPYRESVKAEFGVEFDVRVGINTGLVVVGAVGSDLRVEYTAMGDAVNIAARMEQTAQPGTVQISDDTKKSIEKLFKFEDLGRVEVKGRSEPVPSWRVIEPLARPETTRGIEGLRAPMIGRDAELAVLKEAMEAVQAGGGVVASVMGEAGLGKSRLMSEFKESVGSIPWHEGRSLSYETASAYAPVRGVLRSIIGIEAQTPPSEIWGFVEDAVGDAIPARVAEVAPFITSVLGGEVPQEHAHRLNYLVAEALQEAIFGSVVELVQGICAVDPVVLVFEDLHWADSASLELVGRLLALAESCQLLLVLVYRPRRDDGSWKVRERAERDHPHLHQTIDLSPLDDSDARLLIAELLAVDGLPEDVRVLVLDRSAGNPYFLEEVVRSMIDAGVVGQVDGKWVAIGDVRSVAIPETLAALITTRLDALAPAFRSVAQVGSVLGREFRYEDVAALSGGIGDLDQALAELQKRDLVRETARVPRRVYRFKHALVQQTAYEGILRKQRVKLHAAAGDHMSRSQPDRVEDIAEHFVAAKRSDLALPYLVAAGERHLKAFLLPEAHESLSLAVSTIDEKPAGQDALLKRALEGIGTAHEAAFEMEEAATVYQRLVTEGNRLGNQEMAISGTNKVAFIKGIFFGQREEALEDLIAAESRATEANDGEGLVEACIAQCYLRTGFAEFDEVEFYMKKVAELGEEMGVVETTLFGMAHFANSLVYMTRFDDGLEQAEKTLAKAEEYGHLKYKAEMLTFAIPVCHLRNGDIDSAMVALERGMEVALQIGDRASEAQAAIRQGHIAMQQGSFDEALSSYNRAVIAGQATGIPYVMAVGVCTTGSCYRRIGGSLLQRALELHSETLELMKLPTGTTYGAWMWSEIGHCNLQAGHLDGADELFHRAIDEPTAPMWLMRPSALAGLAETAIGRGDIGAAITAFEEMKEYVTERKMADQYIDVELLGSRLASARGDYEAALRSLSLAESMARNNGLKRILFDVHVLQHAVYDKEGKQEAADKAASLAREVGGEILSGIRDQEVHRAFKAQIEIALGS